MARCGRPLRLVDALGARVPAPPGHETVSQGPGRDWLVLGLGPDPRALAERLPPDARVRYLECPAFADQAGQDWRAAIPGDWREVADFEPEAADNILFYGAAMTLFPDFWAPVRARLLLPCPATAGGPGPGTILVAQKRASLVAPDVVRALGDEGYTVREVDRAGLLDSLERERPELFLSINFAGLDRHGEVQAVLDRAGVPVAAWCLDNPFLCLSGVRTKAWKDLHLFVTDDWFVAPLRAHGARHVHHLPLAAGRGFWSARPDRPDLADAVLYVGRSALADKELFFSGRSVPAAVRDEALARLDDGERPDFGWWVARLGLESLWPGLESRRPGLGAEQASQAWRVRVLAGAARAQAPVVVCGDPGWAGLVDPDRLRLIPAVDYHGPLAGMYASARWVLGTASLLLPRGLSQRHFDVWAAGGCLLTDATPGLALFPRELTAPITYRAPEEIPAKLRELDARRETLARDWRELIASGHTYRHRVRALLSRLVA